MLLAKEPRPGRAKTRLQSEFTAGETARLAAAAIEDTVSAIRGSAVPRRLLVWEGADPVWGQDFALVPQCPGSLNDRLAGAFEAGLREPDAGPVLLIGMDTPQVTPALLEADWRGADAVLGLADDGGYWAIGLRQPDPLVFEGIEMSTERTGAAQLARLFELGYSVRLLPPLRDVDLPTDAEDIAFRYPWLIFSRAHREIIDSRAVQPADRLFDRMFAGWQPPTPGLSGEPLATDLARWNGEADEVDLMVVSRCEPPVIDLGCGPGRMVAALNRSGRPALGVDFSAVAVGTSMRRGALALRRRISDPLPAEGRWGTALLIDSNIGIGGDVTALLRRCCALIGSGGLIICEVDPDQDRHQTSHVVLDVDNLRSPPVPWGRVGGRVLSHLAAALDMLVVEEWSAQGRVFVALRRST